MSNEALWMSDAMLDSLSLQLRDAESRRAEAERAHQVSSHLAYNCRDYCPLMLTHDEHF